MMTIEDRIMALSEKDCRTALLLLLLTRDHADDVDTVLDRIAAEHRRDD
jgi:hypothetical protein